MKWIVSLALLGAVAALIWMLAEPNQANLRTRTVAFDNVYTGVTRLTVHVTVDGGMEQTLTATCTPQTCTFELPLAEGQHTLSMAVERDGLRSAPTAVSVDTRKPGT